MPQQLHFAAPEISSIIIIAGDNNCHYFGITKIIGKTLDSASMEKLKSCASALHANIFDSGTGAYSKDAVLKALKTTYNLTTQDEVNEQLIRVHYLVRVLTHWANQIKSNNDLMSQFTQDLNEVDERTHMLMSYVGLLDPLAGSLVSGPVIGDTGKVSTSNTAQPAASSTSKTVPLAHIEWGSQHFREENPLWNHVDFSIGGSFGFQPALSLLTTPATANATGSTPPKPSTLTTQQYQSAFVWDVNARTNIQAWSMSELSVVATTGQIRLFNGNGGTIVDQGANSTLEIPFNANADSFSWFYEGGMEYNFYNKALEVVHAEKGQLAPLFNIGLFYKKDSRFDQKNGVVGFDSPDRRLDFRFMINGLKIFDRRSDSTSSKPYSISFGVEHERGFGNNPLPSGTRIIIRGDLELLKLINPGASGN